MSELHDLQYKGLSFLQNDSCFRFGTDAVLLASYVRAKHGSLCVDLGAGTGILSVLVAARTGARVTGVEIQPEAAALARENARMSGLDIDILECDVREAAAHISGHVSTVVCNPPYQRPGNNLPQSDARRIALHEAFADIDDFACAAGNLLRTGGRLFMIHRTQRMAEVICALSKYRLEPKRLRIVEPYAGKSAKLFLIEAAKDAAPGLVLETPLVIYGDDGKYTDELKKIYHISE